MIGRHRHVYFLLSLVFLLVVSPFARSGEAVFRVFDLLVLITMVAGVAGVATSRLQVAIGVVLSLGLASAMVHSRLLQPTVFTPLYAAAALAFYGYLTVLLARHVFSHSPRVTTDTLCGALSIYLLMGVIWTFAYVALETIAPGSLDFPDDPGRAGLTPFQRLLGFSFITLTTLGYGNITPATNVADTLCSAEAIVGQVYLTVLVARLVALHIFHSPPPPEEDGGEGV